MPDVTRDESPDVTSDAGSVWDVVWDLGGVFLEWSPPEVVRRWLPDLVPDEESLAELTHRLFQDFVLGSDWSEFDRGTLAAEELARRLAQRAGVGVERITRMIDGIPGSLDRKHDTFALSARLRAAGHRVWFLSNMPGPFAADLDTDPEFVAAFDDGLYSGRMGLVKPEPAIFADAARRLGLPPDGRQVVYLDDRDVNLVEPARLGWTCLLFTDAAHAEADLVALGLLPA
ncbi:MAG: HAD family phosphatase [Kineosporiaceae bacterium]